MPMVVLTEQLQDAQEQLVYLPLPTSVFTAQYAGVTSEHKLAGAHHCANCKISIAFQWKTSFMKST